MESQLGRCGRRIRCGERTKGVLWDFGCRPSHNGPVEIENMHVASQSGGKSLQKLAPGRLAFLERPVGVCAPELQRETDEGGQC